MKFHVHQSIDSDHPCYHWLPLVPGSRIPSSSLFSRSRFRPWKWLGHVLFSFGYIHIESHFKKIKHALESWPNLTNTCQNIESSSKQLLRRYLEHLGALGEEVRRPSRDRSAAGWLNQLSQKGFYAYYRSHWVWWSECDGKNQWIKPPYIFGGKVPKRT